VLIVVTDYFDLVSVAQQILEQRMLMVANHRVFVNKVSCTSVQEESTPDSEGIDSMITGTVNSHCSRTVFIENVPHDYVEFLELHLESEKKGGGAIENVVHKNGGLLVTFEELQGWCF